MFNEEEDMATGSDVEETTGEETAAAEEAAAADAGESELPGDEE